MRFIVNQKYWTIGDRFYINDDQGRAWFSVEGKIFTIGKKMTLFDNAGAEVYFLKQKLFSLTGRWELIQNSNVKGLFRRRVFNAPFSRVYFIESENFKYKIKGNVFAFNFRIYDLNNGNAEVATISKKILKIRDTYVVDVPDNNLDPTPFLVSALIIDATHHKKH
jgi:uncharacterized protein YxjI